jgi:hypothetical protein
VDDTELQGPFLQVAAFCEKALREADGVLSLVRLVDRYTVQTIGPDAPAKMPPQVLNWTLVLVFKAGFATGRYEVRVKVVPPEGAGPPEVAFPVQFDAPHRGANLVAPMQFQADQEGTYWFEIYLGKRLMTRIPLTMVYNPIRGPATPGS